MLTAGVANAFQSSPRSFETPHSVASKRTSLQAPRTDVPVHLKPKIRVPVRSALNDGEIAPSTDGSLLPSGIFLLSTASLALLAFDIHDSTLPETIGVWSLFWTTLAVGWDNFVIGIGKPFFSDVKTNESKYNFLKTISYPRFTAHAVLVPFLYTTCGEIGKAMNVERLQGDLTQTILIAAAAALGIISRVRFVNSDGIELYDTSDSPENAWERDLIWFTYVKPEVLYIVPAIILSIFEIVLGVQGYMEGSHQDAALWMIFAGVAVLYGNSKPREVTRFTGNIVEVLMLWGVFEAATIVL